MKYPGLSKVKFASFSLFVFLGIWYALWVIMITVMIISERKHYAFALGASVEKLRERNSRFDNGSIDYYGIIKYCDSFLAVGEEVQLILPRENWGKYQFLRERGRYLLFPRNYGDNSIAKDHILIYGVDDFDVPGGYEKLIIFGENKYLLGKIKSPEKKE